MRRLFFKIFNGDRRGHLRGRNRVHARHCPSGRPTPGLGRAGTRRGGNSAGPVGSSAAPNSSEAVAHSSEALARNSCAQKGNNAGRRSNRLAPARCRPRSDSRKRLNRNRARRLKGSGRAKRLAAVVDTWRPPGPRKSSSSDAGERHSAFTE